MVFWQRWHWWQQRRPDGRLHHPRWRSKDHTAVVLPPSGPAVGTAATAVPGLVDPAADAVPAVLVPPHTTSHQPLPLLPPCYCCCSSWYPGEDAAGGGVVAGLIYPTEINKHSLVLLPALSIPSMKHTELA